MERARLINLRIFIVAMAIAVLVSSLFLWKIQSEMFVRYPQLERIFPLYLASGLPLLAGLGGVFFEKRWGFWLVVAASMLSFSLEIFSGFYFLKSARIPFFLALLAGLARPMLTPKN